MARVSFIASALLMNWPASGVRPRALEIHRWDDGSMIARHALAGECERNFGAPYYHFHRAELLDVLVRAIPEGILQLRHQCIGVTQDAEHVEVKFRDGASAEADLVI